MTTWPSGARTTHAVVTAESTMPPWSAPRPAGLSRVGSRRMHVEDIEYEADGRRMVGHLAFDEARSGRRPAVLLSHEGPGLDENVKERAERLAGLGYVAFALDYHGDGKPLPIEAAMERLGAMAADPDRTRAVARAGL